MEPELREAFATLSAQMADVGRDARSAAELARETAAKVERLEGEVFGSERPPVLKSETNGTRPTVMGRVSSAEGDVAELTGRLLAVESELKKQSGAMGIDREGLMGWIRKADVKDVIRVLTLVAAIATTIVGIWRGTAPPPVPQTQPPAVHQ